MRQQRSSSSTPCVPSSSVSMLCSHVMPPHSVISITAQLSRYCELNLLPTDTHHRLEIPGSYGTCCSNYPSGFVRHAVFMRHRQGALHTLVHEASDAECPSAAEAVLKSAREPPLTSTMPTCQYRRKPIESGRSPPLHTAERGATGETANTAS
ncbi:hypothetical protein AAFF_G00225300 [Aldrovandia affinis]|uniref:Uncharacterized protein n=1 Tax=Aldrovandia affinis TaxID=143900 RepID=A0AAD7X251_9TELE|nr:hypothetical protein AAFF_G00225300 [Aldrovandia affinis]